MGAYVLHILLTGPVRVGIETLGAHELGAGRYLYVGSAKRGIAQRCARHLRLAREKSGKVHWHVDYLLVDSHCVLAGIDTFPSAEECLVSRRIALRKRVSVPIPGFGSSDCRSGCRAHLYRVGD
jgi:Uri superfamily endonuclease